MVMDLYSSRAGYKEHNGKTCGASPFLHTEAALFLTTQPKCGAELTQAADRLAVHASQSSAAPPSCTGSATSVKVPHDHGGPFGGRHNEAAEFESGGTDNGTGGGG